VAHYKRRCDHDTADTVRRGPTPPSWIVRPDLAGSRLLITLFIYSSIGRWPVAAHRLNVLSMENWAQIHLTARGFEMTIPVVPLVRSTC
jgi:hypothetical protein